MHIQRLWQEGSPPQQSAPLGEIDRSIHETAVSTALAAIDEPGEAPQPDLDGGAANGRIGATLAEGTATLLSEQRGKPSASTSSNSAMLEGEEDEDGLEPDPFGMFEYLSGDPPANPGSIGHPELCPRPCLYFPSGRCVNGEDCNFCHFSHPKRPAHLDKRHRARLKEMPFAECVALVLPILKEKSEALNFGHEVEQHLDVLAAHSVGTARAAGCLPGKKPTRETSALRTALRAMSLRSLLTTLHRAALPASSPERAAIDDILERLRLQSCGRDLELQNIGVTTGPRQ